MNRDQLLRLLSLNLSIDKIELTAAPPFVKIVFNRAELLGLRESKDVIREMLTLYFIRRQVMWQDFSKERRRPVIESLQEAERELDKFARTLNLSKRLKVAGLSRVASSWATACSATWKDLKYAAHHDERRADREALGEALLSLRQRIYPLVRALIEFLPDDDPVAVEATAKWETGLNVLAQAAEAGDREATRAQRGVAPEWDVMLPAEG